MIYRCLPLPLPPFEFSEETDGVVELFSRTSLLLVVGCELTALASRCSDLAGVRAVDIGTSLLS